MMQSRALKGAFIASGHSNDHYFQEDCFFKAGKNGEVAFYRQLDDGTSPFFKENQEMKARIPQLVGFEAVGGKDYIVLKNFLQGRTMAHVVDVKLGRSTVSADSSQEKKERD